MKTSEKIEKVKEILKDKKIAIAFSGGADSTLMCYLANKVCSEILAITIDNNIMPPGFTKHVIDFCKNMNIKQEIIFEDFYKHQNIISNKTNRCYLCRKEMYKHIISKAHEYGFNIIVDGTNISDLVQDRPGISINYEKNIKSPFVEAGLTSKEIHEYLNKKNIPYSHSTTCLMTRIPFNEKFTKEKYDKISKSEQIIYDNTNCKIVKVRQKSSDCIVEVDDLMELKHVNKISSLNEQLKLLGYDEVILKLDEISEYEEIQLTFMRDKFIYQLPYDIDIKHTINHNENIIITEDGMILGKNYKNYEEALKEFIRILPQIRRKI